MKSSITRKRHNRFATVPATFLALVLAFGLAAPAQEAAGPAEAEMSAAPEEGYSDVVTLNVQEASLKQVLNAFSRQTGKNIVIGPDVTGNVTMRLSNTPWQDALDVILKPYGYGYKRVGETIIVSKLEKLVEVEAVEPLVSKVFHLKYLDALAVKEMVESQLSPRGHMSALTVRGQKGWKPESRATRRQEGVTGALARRERDEVTERELEMERLRSKTIVVIDIPAVIARITEILDKVDSMPMQVLIEARFVEVNANFLQDVGFEFGTGATGAQTPGVQPVAVGGAGGVFGVGAQSISGTLEPSAFDATSSEVSDTRPFNAGLSLLFRQLTDVQFEMILHMLEEDDTANLLSAPRILALNDQEATILVGTKYPIIETDQSGETGTTSTSLDYYEDIGIQLNVIPQICENDYVRMIINPKVSTLISTTFAVTAGSETVLTPYPLLSTREAETQILVKSGETVVIGGLIEDNEETSELKVPFLGDIPILGRLFKRETLNNDKKDLLIFLTATIRLSAAEITEEDLAEAAAVEPPILAPEAAVEEEAAPAVVLEETIPEEEPVDPEKKAEAERLAREAAERELEAERIREAQRKAKEQQQNGPDAAE